MFFKIPFQNTNQYPIRIFFIVAFLFMLIQDCTDTVAIFASLENEEKIKTSNFPDNASIEGMAKLQDRYYVSTGARMFDRKVTSQNWGKTKLLHGYSRTSQLVQAKIDTPIYFIAYKEENGEIREKALFTITKEDGMKLLKKENKLETLSITSTGKLFASIRAAKNYSYYSYSNHETSPISFTSLKTNIDGIILDVEVDGIILDVEEFKGTTYLLAQRGLYKVVGAIITDVIIKDDTDTAFRHMMGLLSYDSDDDGTNDTLIVTNRNRIWKTNNGTTWESYKDGNGSTFFTDSLYITQGVFTGLLVGTRRYNTFGISDGYRELPEGSESFRKPSGNKYTSGALYQADVVGFFLDEKENIFFVLTKGSGLWRGSYTNTRAIDWFLE